MTISRWIILRMRMFQIKVVEKIKTYFKFNNFLSENRAVYDIGWKYVVESGRPQMAIQ